MTMVEKIRKALYASKIVSYAQGNLNFSDGRNPSSPYKNMLVVLNYFELGMNSFRII